MSNGKNFSQDGQMPSALTQEPSQQRPRPSTAKSTAGFICGIVSIALSFLSPLFCWIVGIVAIVLTSSYLRAGGTERLARIGRILGIIGIVIGVIVFAIAFITSLMVTAQSYGL